MTEETFVANSRMLSVAIAKPPQFIEIVPGLFSTTVPASGRVAVDPHLASRAKQDAGDDVPLERADCSLRVFEVLVEDIRGGGDEVAARGH